ncbi:hypothetical protein QPK77_00080 [Providencia rettgeri]|uniref:hypothetical protein n=1 Tax=Providencia sp. PROV137 TaxID=2949847 RepID=UPI002349B830|nr:hypothetical protein [Providencia sp. PROV137]EJD6612253.1 hypothetical protein [Providencia rettgeri]MDK3006382.1 hypothetical protein [Providencia rettgeri]HEM7133543.1 hypothetical protein [Providencia rettgeri]
MEYLLIKDNNETEVITCLYKKQKTKGHRFGDAVEPTVSDKYRTTSFKINGYYYNVAYETKKPTEEEFTKMSSGVLDGKGGYIK